MPLNTTFKFPTCKPTFLKISPPQFSNCPTIGKASNPTNLFRPSHPHHKNPLPSTATLTRCQQFFYTIQTIWTACTHLSSKVVRPIFLFSSWTLSLHYNLHEPHHFFYFTFFANHDLRERFEQGNVGFGWSGDSEFSCE